MSTWSEKNPFRDGRSYVFAVPCKKNESSPIWVYNGSQRRGFWSEQKWHVSLEKAARSGYTSFVVSELVLDQMDPHVLFSQIRSYGLRPILQISADSVLPSLGAMIKTYDVGIERWIYQTWPAWEIYESLVESKNCRFVILGIQSNKDCLEHVERIPLFYQKYIDFYFPYFLSNKEKIKPRQLIRWQALLNKKAPELVIGSANGIDIYEPRIQEMAELEPIHGPIYRSHQELRPQFSVVIPVYNTGLYLLNTLRHLEKQNFPKDQFEVVIVDDGGTDRVSEMMVDLVRDFEMPLTILYYPRLAQRKMGDSQFRAGLARNYGVKWARGDYLVFLDSDILTPPHFLQTCAQRHQHHSVVQWRRDYLKKSIPCATIQYHEIGENHCFVPEGGYWHQFYQQSEKVGWNSLPDHWKYSCTYAFSLKRDLFKRIGWFRKTFCFYGLEDTDLGWRLGQGGETFFLEPTPVYHLYHESTRSEFFNSFYRRQKLLKTTAEIFFYNNLSPDIYRVFQYLLNSWIF